MANPFFRFKEFTVYHDRCAMKVTTDACLFGAWCAEEIKVHNSKYALDIGTGTGLLSLMVAQKNNLMIDAIDIDRDAVVQAKQNSEGSPWHSTINVICADVRRYTFDRTFDVIFSNPPFYEKEIESGNAGKNTAHHGHGLKLVDLLQCIKTNLKEDGTFYLLLPYKRWTEIEDYLNQTGLYIHKKLIVSPTAVHQPSRIMVKGKHDAADIDIQKVAIHNAERNYTEDFKSLLKDYYLYL